LLSQSSLAGERVRRATEVSFQGVVAFVWAEGVCLREGRLSVSKGGETEGQKDATVRRRVLRKAVEEETW